jgi:hypothetical protein
LPHKVYDVQTDLDPLALSELAAETFMVWLRFALGQQELGGKKLKHASGRYASAISWRRTGVAKVAIIADEDAIKEAGSIEYGHPAVDLRSKMLYGGRAHLSKQGYMYRILPLRPNSWRSTPTLNPSMIIDTLSGGRVRAGVAKMWATPRPYVDKGSRFRTMSDKPGASRWIIPEFHPYAPGQFLADLLREQFGRR